MTRLVLELAALTGIAPQSLMDLPTEWLTTMAEIVRETQA